MKKLWVFGDSFTFGHGCNDMCKSDTSEEYKFYKKEGDDIWSNHLGNLLNCEVVNLGKNGGSNDYILNSIIENYNNILKNDYVVIGKTFPSRMDVPVNNKWESALNYRELHDDVRLVSNDEIDDDSYISLLNFQYHFLGNPLYKKRQDSWFLFLRDRFLYDMGVNSCIIWDVTEQLRFDTIKNDTNGKINDTHYSYKGHLQFSNYIYSKIQNRMI